MLSRSPGSSSTSVSPPHPPSSIRHGGRLSARGPGDLPASAFSAGKRDPSFYLGLRSPLLFSVHQGAYPIPGGSGPHTRSRNSMDALPCTVRVSGSLEHSTSPLPEIPYGPDPVSFRLTGPTDRGEGKGRSCSHLPDRVETFHRHRPCRRSPSEFSAPLPNHGVGSALFESSQGERLPMRHPRRYRPRHHRALTDLDLPLGMQALPPTARMRCGFKRVFDATVCCNRATAQCGATSPSPGQPQNDLPTPEP